MFNLCGEMSNFIALHPRITTVLLCFVLALAFGLVLSYVTPHESLAVWRRFYSTRAAVILSNVTRLFLLLVVSVTFLINATCT
jgi:hypothetical protein